MNAVGVGDWLECLTDGTRGVFRKGALYCVSAIDDREAQCDVCGRTDEPGLEFHYMPMAPDAGWAACRFKPVYRPRATLIESLLTPADAPVEHERADA